MKLTSNEFYAKWVSETEQWVVSLWTVAAVFQNLLLPLEVAKLFFRRNSSDTLSVKAPSQWCIHLPMVINTVTIAKNESRE